MNTEATRSKNWCSANLVAPAAALAILPFLLWSFFTFPIDDDFSLTQRPESWAGLHQQLSVFYEGHSGLYTGTFLRYVHAVSTHMRGYWTIPVCVMLGHWLVAFWAVMRVGRGRAPWWRLAGYALLWPAFYVCTMPSTSETLYWATGAIEYESGNLLFASLVIVTAGVILGEERALRIRMYAIAYGIVIVLCGTHYVHVFNCLVYCFLLWLLSAIRSRQIQWGLFGLFLMAGVCGLFALSAPGNFARQINLVGANAVPPLRSLGIAGFSFLRFVARFIMSLQVVIFLGMVSQFIRLDRRTSRSQRLIELVSVLLWCFALYGVFVLSALGRVDPPMMRTQNSLYFDSLFALAWLLSLLPRRVLTLIRSDNGQRWACACALVLFLTPNCITATRELVGSATQYKRQWQNRCRIVADAKAERQPNVEIPSLVIRPLTVCHGEFMGADTNFWANTAAAHYFGVNSMRVVKKGVEGSSQ